MDFYCILYGYSWCFIWRFCSVSALDTQKFDVHKCQQKWENIVSSCDDKPQDMYPLMNFMKRIGINVQLTYLSTQALDFTYNLFDKNTMLEYVNDTKLVMKQEYEQYTLNRFFGIVASSKPEVF